MLREGGAEQLGGGSLRDVCRLQKPLISAPNNITHTSLLHMCRLELSPFQY